MPAYADTKPHGGQDSQKIPVGSPLAVLGIFLEALRERFREDANIPWTWRPDSTLTGILIELGYNDSIEVRNFSPAVYVTRSMSRPTQMVIGDRVDVNLPDHKETNTAMMVTTLTIDCASNDQGESAMLGDTVQHFLLASRQILAAYFGFHQVDYPVLGQTAPYEQAQGMFTTPVQLEVQHQVRWSTVKIRPLLQSIGARLLDSRTNADASGAFASSALHSLGRSYPLDPPAPVSEPGSSIPEIPEPAPPEPGAVVFPESAFFLPNRPLNGATNAVNKTFTVTVPFIHTDTIREIVYRNGIRVDPASYSVPDSQTIVFTTAPEPGDLLLLDSYVAR